MKYFLSVGAIFKNESYIIEEWIEHYINEGVEHFYLINNDSTDDFRSKILKYEKIITLIEDDRRHQQTTIYNDHFSKLKTETEWLMIVDLDEFAYSKSLTINEYLKRVSSDVDAISMPWKIFGSSKFIKQPKSVIHSFLWRLSTYTKHCVWQKQIVRTKQVKRFDIHITEVEGKTIRSTGEDFIFSDDLTQMSVEDSKDFYNRSELQINHYAIQSYRWFMKIKTTRGSATRNYNIRNENYFKAYDHNDLFDDELSIKTESKTIPLDFSFSSYLKYNSDLSHLIGRELLDHYIDHGMRENRRCSSINLDEFYKFLNIYTNINSYETLLKIKHLSAIRRIDTLITRVESYIPYLLKLAKKYVVYIGISSDLSKFYTCVRIYNFQEFYGVTFYLLKSNKMQ